MWPWEHAVVGYLAYSLFCRLYYRDSPGGFDALVVVVAAVLPDLIDKPLAWSFGFVETGYALAHSIFVAVPLVAAVWVYCHTTERERVGTAFGIGYLLHLPGDVLYLTVINDGSHFGILLWPLVSVETSGHSYGFVRESILRILQFRMDLLAGDLSLYAKGQLLLAAFVVVLWLFDGAPVLRDLLGAAKRVVRAALNPGT